MPVTFAYCIKFLSVLFPNGIHGLERYFPYRLHHLTLFSFAFNGLYNNTPADNTAAGDFLFLKEFA
jgi:hypothetical protein